MQFIFRSGHRPRLSRDLLNGSRIQNAELIVIAGLKRAPCVNSVSAPFLQRRPDWLRCAAGFYTIWDLRPLREGSSWMTDEGVRKWSCLTALELETVDLPPLLLARAGRDNALLLEGTDAFVRRARERGVDLTVLDHPTGQHGFDTRDDDERSREIIRQALEFFVRHLSL